jgi:hypothetical protein
MANGATAGQFRAQEMIGYRFSASKRYRLASVRMCNIVEHVPAAPNHPRKHVDTLNKYADTLNQNIDCDDLNDHFKCLRDSKIALLKKRVPAR